jgi:hypothetical protein
MKTYKETLFFIGKCLTINHEKHNRILVEKDLKAGHIDWDTVVKVSTAHYVFPALYCNLKKANFLDYLPQDLIDYMKYITDLNRERNQQIITEVKEINTLLLANNITPVFLKGTGNLLEGLYEDLGERMVNDIDFIVSKDEYGKAIEIIQNIGYYTNIKTNYVHPGFKHYPGMLRENCIAAIEIHKELLVERYAQEFNYNTIIKDTQIINNINVLSFRNQLALTVFANQINDHGFYYKNIALRNAYDAFILSKKTTAKKILPKFNSLKKPLNCFLAICYETFNQPVSLLYHINENTASYLKDFNKIITDDAFRKKHTKRTAKKIALNHSLRMIYKSIFNKEHRTYFLKTIQDKKWIKRKMVESGFIKPKPNI